VPSASPLALSTSPWRALRRPSYAAWSVANLVSNIGTWLQLVAQNVLVLQLTGSAALAGLCATVSAAPALLLSPVGGALVDRYSKRVIAGLAQTALALVAVLTAVLAWQDALGPVVLVAFAFVSGAVGALNAPATALLGNELVVPEDVPSAISVGSVITTVGRVAGAALAGVVLATGGVAIAYALNAVSFLAVTAVIAGLPRVRPGIAERRARPRSRRDDLLGGVRWLTAQPQLLLLAVVSGLAALLGRNYGLVLAPLTLTALGAGGAGYGTVNVALGVGATLGALAAGRLRRPRVRLAVLLAVAGAAVQIAIAGAPTLAVLVAGAVLMSALESVAATASATLLMTVPPEEVRGRVMGAWGSVSTLCAMVGPLLLGGLLSLLGPRAGLAAGGVLFLAAVVTVTQVYLIRVHGRVAGVRAWRTLLRPVPVIAPAPA
jgi:MFS family permease